MIMIGKTLRLKKCDALYAECGEYLLLGFSDWLVPNGSCHYRICWTKVLVLPARPGVNELVKLCRISSP